MNYKKLEHPQFLVNLYINVCNKKPKFRYICRRANQFFTHKICKKYEISQDETKLKITMLNIEAFTYQNIRNSKVLSYYLVRYSNLPFRKLIFKIFLEIYFFKIYIKSLYRSFLFIFQIISLKDDNQNMTDKICYFFDMPKPIDNEGRLKLHKTIFTSILHDSNSKIAKFDCEKKNRWFDLYKIDLKSKKKFFFECCFYIFLSFFNLFENKKRYKSYMLDEILKSIAIKHFNSVKNHIHYLNFVANGCYKPFWLTLSETKFKTQSSFVWDSISIFPKYFSKIDLFSYNIPKMTWNREYVISKNHKNLLIKLRNNNRTNYKILKYTDIYTNNVKINFPKKSYILIFPISPHSLNFTLPDASIHDIYGTSITETTIKFINDIIEVCMENNLYAIIKDKRLSYASDQTYSEYLNDIKSNNRIFVITEHTSIKKLIENSIGTISFPITSTGEITNKLNIPSAFYSVNKSLNGDKIEFMKNTLLTSKKELNTWIKKLI